MGAARDIVITGGALWGLHIVFAAVQSDFSLFSSLLQTTGIAITREHENVAMLSAKHVRDFFNEQFVLPASIRKYVLILAKGCSSTYYKSEREYN